MKQVHHSSSLVPAGQNGRLLLAVWWLLCQANIAWWGSFPSQKSHQSSQRLGFVAIYVFTNTIHLALCPLFLYSTSCLSLASTCCSNLNCFGVHMRLANSGPSCLSRELQAHYTHSVPTWFHHRIHKRLHWWITINGECNGESWKLCCWLCVVDWRCLESWVPTAWEYGPQYQSTWYHSPPKIPCTTHSI